MTKSILIDAIEIVKLFLHSGFSLTDYLNKNKLIYLYTQVSISDQKYHDLKFAFRLLMKIKFQKTIFYTNLI
jgi:hypothetical protein